MPEVTYRPMTEDDVDALVGLMAAAEAVDRTEEHYDADDVREEMADPQVDRATDWRLAELDGELVGFAQLHPRAPDGGTQRIHVGGVVHPAHRGRGIASELVPWAVARAETYAAERGVRPILSATAPDDVPDAADVLEAHGLHAHRWTFVMEADLTGPLPEAGPLPEGFTLHTWEGLDADEIRETHNVAFVDHPGFAPWDPPMWQQWVTGSRNDRPAMSLVLRDPEGRIASYVHTLEYAASEAATGRRESFVGKVGTVPDHRRRGLAGLLLRHAMHRYQQEGYAATSLDVDSENPTGANSVYEQAGFRVTRRWTNFESR